MYALAFSSFVSFALAQQPIVNFKFDTDPFTLRAVSSVDGIVRKQASQLHEAIVSKSLLVDTVAKIMHDNLDLLGKRHKRD